MAELPEVHSMVKYLRKQPIFDLPIAEVIAKHPRFNMEKEELVGLSIKYVTRKGKYILFHLENGFLLFHPRWTGLWEWSPSPWTFDLLEYPRKYKQMNDIRFAIRFEGSPDLLVLHDSRALSVLQFKKVDRPSRIPELIKQGPDVLETDTLDLDFLDQQRIAKHELLTTMTYHSIKALLLDQSVAAGCGNIYACEVLWWMGIDPRRPATSVSNTAETYKKLRILLQYSIDSDLDYSKCVRVFRRWSCQRCGNPIQRVPQDGRGTYYCAQCQH